MPRFPWFFDVGTQAGSGSVRYGGNGLAAPLRLDVGVEFACAGSNGGVMTGSLERPDRHPPVLSERRQRRRSGRGARPPGRANGRRQRRRRTRRRADRTRRAPHPLLRHRAWPKVWTTAVSPVGGVRRHNWRPGVRRYGSESTSPHSNPARSSERATSASFPTLMCSARCSLESRLTIGLP